MPECNTFTSMWNTLILVFLLLLIVFGKVDLENEVMERPNHYSFILQPEATYEKSLNMCKSKKGQFPSIHNVESFLSNAHSALLQEKVWIPVRKIKLSSWTAVSGDDIGFVENSTNVGDCAILRVKENTLQPRQCSVRTSGYICYLYNRQYCKRHICLTTTNTAYILGQQYVSWFVAMKKCTKMGSALAAFSTQERNILVDVINKKLNQSDGEYYTGIVRSEWKSGAEADIYNMYNWERREPSENGSCVVISGKYHQWRVTSCKDRNRFLCLHRGKPPWLHPDFVRSNTTILPYENETVDYYQGNQLDTGSKVVMGIIFTGNVLLVLVWTWELCHSSKETSTQEEKENTLNVLREISGRLQPEETESIPITVTAEVHEFQHGKQTAPLATEEETSSLSSVHSEVQEDLLLEEASGSTEVERKNNKNSLRHLWIMLFVYFFFHIPHMPIFFCLTVLNGKLGAVAGSLMEAGALTESLIVVKIFKKLRTRWTLFTCSLSRVLFVASNLYPCYYTLLPAAFFLSFGRCVSDTFLHNYALQVKKSQLFLVNDPFQAVAFLFYMVAVIAGVIITALVLNFVKGPPDFNLCSGLGQEDIVTGQKTHQANNTTTLTHNSELNGSDLYNYDTQTCGLNYCIAPEDLLSPESLTLIPYYTRIVFIGILAVCALAGLFLSCFLTNKTPPKDYVARWPLCKWDYKDKKFLLTIPTHVLVWNGFCILTLTFSKAIAVCSLGVHLYGYIILTVCGTLVLGTSLYKAFRRPKSLGVRISISYFLYGAFCIISLEWKHQKIHPALPFILTILLTLAILISYSTLNKFHVMTEDLKLKTYLLREIVNLISCMLCAILCYKVQIYIFIALIALSFVSCVILYANELYHEKIISLPDSKEQKINKKNKKRKKKRKYALLKLIRENIKELSVRIKNLIDSFYKFPVP